MKINLFTDCHGNDLTVPYSEHQFVVNQMVKELPMEIQYNYNFLPRDSNNFGGKRWELGEGKEEVREGHTHTHTVKKQEREK